MTNVTVRPVGTINVKMNQSAQKVVSSATTFQGAGPTDFQGQINEIRVIAENALSVAEGISNTAQTALVIGQASYDTANTKLNLSGGTITGSLSVTQHLITNTFDANTVSILNVTIDGGTFS